MYVYISYKKIEKIYQTRIHLQQLPAAPNPLILDQFVPSSFFFRLCLPKSPETKESKVQRLEGGGAAAFLHRAQHALLFDIPHSLLKLSPSPYLHTYSPLHFLIESALCPQTPTIRLSCLEIETVGED
jgi:hypothetical protein